MGYISYSLDYYRNELKKLENNSATHNSLCHARRLMRMLDDLANEGYT